jgi:hypothetical protein
MDEAAAPRPESTDVSTAKEGYRNDLGKFIALSAAKLSSLGWERFIAESRGQSNISPEIAHIEHPASLLLHHLGLHGTPVALNTPAWSLERLDFAHKRGSHQSSSAHLEFLRGEMADMVEKGFWVVVPYKQVRHLPNLRLSPLGVVPQRDRRPRTIVDYTYSDVNQETKSMSPKEAMQFGKALPRLLQKIRFADPSFGPVYMLKVDIADGFYRVWVEAQGIPSLGVCFPNEPGEEALVAFPLALPMGWTESPPYFCAFTETITDIANAHITRQADPPPHRLESEAEAAPTPPHDDREWYWVGKGGGRGESKQHRNSLPDNGGAPPLCHRHESRIGQATQSPRGDNRVLPRRQGELSGAEVTTDDNVSHEPERQLPRHHSGPTAFPVPSGGDEAVAGRFTMAVSTEPSSQSPRVPALLAVNTAGGKGFPRRQGDGVLRQRPESTGVEAGPTRGPDLPTLTGRGQTDLRFEAPPFVPDSGLHPGQLPRKRKGGPLAYTDVFVDDFVQVAQGSNARLNRVRRILLHTIDSVWRGLETHDPPSRQEPASVKKMLKGDACWATVKVILGWLVDTVRGTIELPPHRAERLQELLLDALGRKRVSLKHWQQLLGELRSMVLAIPGGEGLFSHLQGAIRQSAQKRVRLTTLVHHQLADFKFLADDLGRRPTRIAEIVPTDATHVGASDASRGGMGGVWLPPPMAQRLPGVTYPPPLVWREAFPKAVQLDLVSFENPLGSISNSDLELAGNLCHQDVLVNATPCDELTLASLSDNTPAVAWMKRGSISGDGPAAYLLRLAALHRRHYRYLLEISHIPGLANAMADDSSRLWELSNAALIAHFNTQYPQEEPWQLRQLRPSMLTATICALQRKRLSPESFLPERLPLTRCGKSGALSAGDSTSTRCSRGSPTKSPHFRYLPSESDPARSHPSISRCDLEQWRSTSAPWVRSSPFWGPKTLEIPYSPTRSTSASNGNCGPMQRKTPRHVE